MTIADRIKEKRLELGWNQEDLAKRMGYKAMKSIYRNNIASKSKYYAKKMNRHLSGIIKEDAN